MTIAIDIDGVITNLDFLPKGEERFIDKKLKINFINNNLLKKMFFHSICFYSKHAIIRNSMSKLIRALKDDGNKIIIITKRQFIDDDKANEYLKLLIELYLIDHDIPFDEILYAKNDKLEECIKAEADILIDDSIKIAKAVSAQIPVILYKNNMKYENNNIIEANNPTEVLKILNTYKQGISLNLIKK